MREKPRPQSERLRRSFKRWADWYINQWQRTIDYYKPYAKADRPDLIDTIRHFRRQQRILRKAIANFEAGYLGACIKGLQWSAPHHGMEDLPIGIWKLLFPWCYAAGQRPRWSLERRLKEERRLERVALRKATSHRR